ncbi:hypothetical protein [Deinococcus sp.]|uniref:hypothetical protein n=1 Tax=Deinococcus sp. TaxID=47478 RepID=UPI002869E9C3|nr:hypothetical protein [Deinococcus sp.]
MPNTTGPWVDTLLPGAVMTLRTSTSNTSAGMVWTRLLIRPGINSIKELQITKMPLAKACNMEFDLTCKK